MTIGDWYGLALLSVVALVIGSFVGMLARRLPAGASLAGRSRCPGCGAPLAARDLVPLASWAWLGGRCRRCRAPIALYYPAVELAALGVALWAWTALSGWLLWAGCCFGWALLALALIDLRSLVLPDMLTLPLLPAGWAVAWYAAPETLADNLAGAAAGYAVFALIAWAYRRWRGREGLGGGDAKLLAGLGAWVGATGLPSVVLLASLLALAAVLAARAFRGRAALGEHVPFGPSLAAAGWVVWLYGPFGLAGGGS